MHAIKAIYDGVSFMPKQAIPVKEKYEVVITFVEPINEDTSDTPNMTKPEKLPRSGALGLWQGKVRMSDDFNEPLEEMKTSI